MSILRLSSIAYGLLFSGLSLAQSPPGSGFGNAIATSFLDHDAPISGFDGKTFLRENIPFIDIPDQLIQDVYYYRWTSTQRNLRYIIAGTGFISTEFVQPVGYAQAFGTIVAAAGHQLDESKWLRSQFYAQDYIEVYNRGPANSTQYTEWIAYVTNQRALITGDSAFLASQLDDMVRAFEEWNKVFDSTAGLYYYQPVWDAQELSLPGFIVDPNAEHGDLQKDGPDTYRPSHNAYMAANARAIASAARVAGNAEVEAKYTGIAEDVEGAFYDRMWAPEQKFFMDIIRPDNPDLTPLTGRQEVGFYPYRFGIGLSEEYAQPAVDTLFDPDGFLTEFGPPTLEVRDPWYKPDKSPEEYCELPRTDYAVFLSS
jgi:glycogen debranching enzyme